MIEMHEKINLLGVRISKASPSEVLREIEASIRSGDRLTISFVNPHTMNLVMRNTQLRDDLNSLDLVCADGIGVVWASRFLGVSLKERVSADILGPGLFKLASSRGFKVYLLGARPGIVDKTADNLRKVFPMLEIAGSYHGYFAKEENDSVVKRVNESAADIVLVGLGASLQERWIVENADKVRASVLITCGGYFDQMAQRVHYYPSWAYRYRLNWLYRLLREPTRLWERYFIELPYFAWWVIKTRFHTSGARASAEGCKD